MNLLKTHPWRGSHVARCCFKEAAAKSYICPNSKSFCDDLQGAINGVLLEDIVIAAGDWSARPGVADMASSDCLVNFALMSHPVASNTDIGTSCLDPPTTDPPENRLITC